MSTFNIASVLEQTVTVPFEFTPKNATEPVIINMVVYVERITSDLLDRIAEAEEKSAAEFMRVLIAEIAKQWDLDWNGEPFPPTEENLRRCPLTFIGAAGRAILAMWRGNPTNEPNSQNTSDQEESAAQSQETTSSSEPLDT